MPSTFLPPVSLSSPNFIASMNSFGRPPPGSGNPPPPPGSDGSAATSPNVPIGQLGSATPASRNGTPSTAPGNGTGGISGNGLRPSYGLMTERERERERERQRELANKPYPSYSNQTSSSSSSSSSMLPRPADAAPIASSTSSHAHGNSQQHPGPHHHHHHHHHTHPSQTSAQPPPADVAKNNAYPGRMPVNIGRLSGGYGLFGGGSFREQEMREKERQDRLQRERERERDLTKPSVDKSPGNRPSSIVNPTNPYPRPSLPPSPTASRNLPAPTSVTSASKPSISPQMVPANASTTATGTPRPNLPLPHFSTLGSRSLPSPFERERSGSASVVASPAVTPATEQPPSASGHRRTPSGSSARGPEPMSSIGGLKSPTKTNPQASASARSLYSAPPPLAQANRDPQRSPVARASTAASPREREGVVSPTTAAASKAPTTASNAPPTVATQSSQANRGPYSSYGGYGGGPSYPGTFGGFGLGGFGGYGAFGPRWDRDREREVREQREEERKRREKDMADQREQREARARAEKEREERDAKWLKARERERAGAAYNVEAFQPPRQGATSASTQPPASAGDPYRARQAAIQTPYDHKPNYSHHIEVLNHPDRQGYPGASTTAAEPVPVSVMQQVAPQREPRPYGYKAEPPKYQYTPRDKRPRMDAAVEEAQAHRRTSATSKSKRRKEEDKKSPIVAVPKERDWAALTVPVKKWPEVNSMPVESWLRTISDVTRVISTEIYTGPDWTLAKSGATQPEYEGGLVMVRIGGGFLGKGWKVRGEPEWDEALPLPGSEVVCGGSDKNRRIWGTDVYTDDSDIGQVLVHAGWIKWLDRSGTGVDRRDEEFIVVAVRVVPRLVRYIATERNGVTTRGWGNGHDGASIVVERVERHRVDKKYLTSRKKSLRIADWARERQFVAPLPLQDETRKVNGVEDLSLMFCTAVAGKSGVIAGFKYRPEALEGWLDVPEEGDSNARSLWTHRLILEDSDRTYELWLNPHSVTEAPRINLVQKSVDLSTDETTLLDNALIDQNAILLPEGIAIRKSAKAQAPFTEEVEENEKGWLLQVGTFRWGGRVEGDWLEEEGWEWMRENEDEANGAM
ncbi:hypothetical protein IAR55_005448 [Kwoniella newhampshirensis]|uniref:Uncharacterized protein n=1 Tax=Kwoniella newhampshirensis TaxID=1651941 RepID=A0AAW0YWD4_9TREE